MAFEYLTKDELIKETGAKTKAGMIRALIANGVRHSIKVNGWPSCTWADILSGGKFKRTQEPEAWRPRKAG